MSRRELRQLIGSMLAAAGVLALIGFAVVRVFGWAVGPVAFVCACALAIIAGLWLSGD